MNIIQRSLLTCPHCLVSEELLMPVDACQFFYRCPHCQETIRPQEGDCCVFCSYGSVPCPPIQLQRATGAPNACCGSSHVPTSTC